MYLISCGFLYRWGFEAQNRWGTIIDHHQEGVATWFYLCLHDTWKSLLSYWKTSTVWSHSCLLRNHDKYPQCWLVHLNTVFKLQQSCTCSVVSPGWVKLRYDQKTFASCSVYWQHLNMLLIHHSNDVTSSSSLLKDNQESTKFALCSDSCFRLRSLSGRLWLEPTHLSNGVRWPPLSHAKVGISSVVSFALTRARTHTKQAWKNVSRHSVPLRSVALPVVPHQESWQAHGLLKDL